MFYVERETAAVPFSREIATESCGYVQDPFHLWGGRDISGIAVEFTEHVADESAIFAVEPCTVAVEGSDDL